MATYSTLKYGSKGDDVKTLQNLLLEKAGYTGNVNGQFGTGTESALKRYQQSQGLESSGIADSATWEKLLYKEATTPSGVTYDANKMTATQADLNNLETNKPAAYVSPYQQQIDQLLGEIQGRGAFTYDYAADPVYQQMAERYQQMGKTAMQDTTAQAAALTGGYGNSYATAAGQQAYGNYLQGINDAVPDLYNTALNQYNQQGTDLYNRLTAVQGQEQNAYQQYADKADDYYTQLAYYYQKAQDEQAQANWQSEYDLAAAKTKSSSSGGGSGGSKKSSGDGGSIDYGADKKTDTFTESEAYNIAKAIWTSESNIGNAYSELNKMVANKQITSDVAASVKKKLTADQWKNAGSAAHRK